jgi:hypothetical protein
MARAIMWLNVLIQAGIATAIIPQVVIIMGLMIPVIVISLETAFTVQVIAVRSCWNYSLVVYAIATASIATTIFLKEASAVRRGLSSDLGECIKEK